MRSVFPLLCTLFLCIKFCTAQQIASPAELNDRLNFIYSHVFENIDTSYINYRQECSQLIKEDKDQMRSNGYRTLALLDLYSNKYNTAITYFKKAIQLDSACFICYRKLHWIYWYQKNDYGAATSLWRTATRQFENKLKEDSADVNSWQRLYVMYSLNEGTRSKNVKGRMTNIAHKTVLMDSANAYYWWQYSFHQENDVAGMEYSLKKAVQLNSKEDVFWNGLANFYADHKKIPVLKQLLEEVKPATGENMHYWYQQKAHYYYTVGLKNEALAVFKEAKANGYDIVYK
ncbi:MAG: hypothetical protein QM791_04540 [Ferruginibacter sp.]